MEIIKFEIQINAIEEQKIDCLISNEKETIRLSYVLAEEQIEMADRSSLAEVIIKNQFQFRKIIRSALKRPVTLNQTIKGIFIEGFNFLEESDFCDYIRVDRRHGKLEISTSLVEMENTPKIFADGSYACETQKSGYAGITEDPDGTQQIYSHTFNSGGSNLMELLAVMEGLQRLKFEERIQVNTDSRFVIRGLAQWVHFWKHNNWQTAFSREVKFVKYWQQMDQLCEDKIIEYKWIKGHSGHEKQDFCHQLAIDTVRQLNRNMIS